MFRLALILLILTPALLRAHPGGLDKRGCHRDRKAGGYHCHRGPHKGRSWPTRSEGRAAMKKAQETPASAPPLERTIESFSGKVVRVVDGDTIDVRKGRKRVRILLWAADAPEKGRPHWKAARKAVRKYVLGKEVRVDVYDKDDDGRRTGELFIGKSSLNRMLVVDGLARWIREQAPDDEGFKANEDYARRAKLGIWAEEPVSADQLDPR
ncbi:thermonuclease family protein [Elusimicrobiota bacterium]